MKRDNYQSSPKSRTINKCIGIIIKDLDDPFYTSIILGVKEYASEKGYLVIIMSSDHDYEYEKKLLRLFSLKEIDGVIIAPVQGKISEIEHLFKLKMTKYPFVLLEDIKGIQTNVVTVDYMNATKHTVKYLMDNGHEKIVLFMGNSLSSYTREKTEGFMQAFSESTLAFCEDMIVSIGLEYGECVNNTIKYFEKKNKENYPTAVICFNDLQAFAVMEALKDMNIKVPDDISVVGSDDIHYALSYSKPITTIRTPLNEMGRKAAEILIRDIESFDVFNEEKVVFNGELIIGETTKNIRTVTIKNRY